MGQTQSETISLSEFSEKITGITVLLLSSQLNTGVNFAPVQNITNGSKNTLPLLTDKPESLPSMEKIIELYLNYYDHDRSDYINKYIEEQILDNQEHLNAFIGLLITTLKKKQPQKPVVEQIKPQAAFKPQREQSIRSVATVPQQESAPSRREPSRNEKASKLILDDTTLNQNWPEDNFKVKDKDKVKPRSADINPVKGSTKLQKRIHQLDQAIDVERIAHERFIEARANIDSSYEVQEDADDVEIQSQDVDQTGDLPHNEEFEHI
jgi:hypothetical protein